MVDFLFGQNISFMCSLPPPPPSLPPPLPLSRRCTIVPILFVYGDGKGVHRARTPGRLIVVDFLFGQNVYFLCSLLPPPPPLPLPLPNRPRRAYIRPRDCACGWVSVGSTSTM